MKVNMTAYGESRVEEVHIDDFDVWNMCDDLALIILPMLKKLKEIKHGAGHVDDEDVPEELRSTNASPKENEWDTDDLFFARYEWILSEMIWAFEQIVNPDSDAQFHTGGSNITFEPIEGSDYQKLVLDPTHVFNKEGYVAHNTRVQNGTTLFGKYFQSLWD